MISTRTVSRRIRRELTRPADRIVPVKRQKDADNPMGTESASAVDVNYHSSVALKTISEVERDDWPWPYHGVNNGDEGMPADVPADVADDRDIFLRGRHFG